MRDTHDPVVGYIVWQVITYADGRKIEVNAFGVDHRFTAHDAALASARRLLSRAEPDESFFIVTKRAYSGCDWDHMEPVTVTEEVTL